MFDDRLTILKRERDAAIARAEKAEAQAVEFQRQRNAAEAELAALKRAPTAEAHSPLPTAADVLECAKTWDWQPGEDVIRGAAEFLQAIGLVAPPIEAPVTRAEVETIAREVVAETLDVFVAHLRKRGHVTTYFVDSMGRAIERLRGQGEVGP